MSILWVLIIVLLVLAVAGNPGFGYHTFGWGPSGIVGTILVVLLILLLLGRI